MGIASLFQKRKALRRAPGVLERSELEFLLIGENNASTAAPN